MTIPQMSTDEAVRSLHSGPEGLSAAEAARRLDEYGPNRVERTRGDPLARRFLGEFVHFFALILWVAAGLAFLADAREPGQGMNTLGWAIVGVIVVNSLFSFAQVYRAERALAALERLLPPRVRVMRDGVFAEVAAAELVPGDIVALEAGDLVPADARLIEAFAVRVDNATLTGESTPLPRDAEPCPTAVGHGNGDFHATNLVLAGTTLVAGEARAVVFATGMRTEFGKIARLTQSAGDATFPLQAEIAFVSRVIAAMSVGLGVVFFLVGRAVGVPFWANAVFAIGVIVANVPEGLLPTVTLSLAIGAQRMARRRVLIRRLPAVETLGSATVICTDKTGTLTENRMHAVALDLGTGRLSLDDPAALPHAPAARRALEVARGCHTLKPAASGEGYLGDPTEIALVAMAEAAFGPADARPERRDEIPFDSDRMRLSILVADTDGLTLLTKGALESVLPLCTRMFEGDAEIALTDARRAEARAAMDAMAEEGLRVLALATRRVAGDEPRESWETGLTFLGLVGLHDPPRPEVAPAIQTCREAGIRVVMITGDHPHTATAIARQIGLVASPSPVVVTGDRLSRMSDIQLQLVLDAPEVLFARASSDQKLRIVAALQRKGEIVAVTGDGINDAPALKHADIGIAMGKTGTDVAREAGDMVLTDDNFASIVAAVEEGRGVFDNIRKFLTYCLTSNVPELVPYLAFVLLRVPLALTVVQILAIDLGTDLLPALALGAEPPEPGVMRRPPRTRGQRLLSGAVLARVYLWLGPLEAFAAMCTFFLVLHRGGWTYGAALAAHDPLYLRATTAALAAVVLMQAVNVVCCRSHDRSALARGPRRNRLIAWGIGVELALLASVILTPFGRSLFGTAPIAAADLLLALPLAALMLALEEGRKWLVRRRAARTPPNTPRPGTRRRRFVDIAARGDYDARVDRSRRAHQRAS